MKPILTAFVCGLTLAACTPLGLYYKKGAPVQSARDAQTACEVQAAKDVPVRNETYVIPGRHTPPRQVCNSDGVCHTRPGVFVPPEFVTRDANKDLRAKATDMCMRQKGYRYVNIPACEPAVAQQVSPGQTQRLPKLAQNSCVVRAQGGSWQIVTPQ